MLNVNYLYTYTTSFCLNLKELFPNRNEFESNVIYEMSKKKYTAYLQLHVNKYCICISPCVPGRKISFEKSATGFSVKFGRKTTEVIQEFDAFVSNVDVDPQR